MLYFRSDKIEYCRVHFKLFQYLFSVFFSVIHMLNQYIGAPRCRNYSFSEQRINCSDGLAYPNDFLAVGKWFAVLGRADSYRSPDFFYNLTLVSTQKVIDELIILLAFKISCSYMGIPISKRKVPKITCHRRKSLEVKITKWLLAYVILYLILNTRNPEFVFWFWEVIAMKSCRINNNIKIRLKIFFLGHLAKFNLS